MIWQLAPRGGRALSASLLYSRVLGKGTLRMHSDRSVKCHDEQRSIVFVSYVRKQRLSSQDVDQSREVGRKGRRVELIIVCVHV